MHQPGKVANPARGQLNRKNEYFPVPVRALEFETGSAVLSRASLVISILRLNLINVHISLFRVCVFFVSIQMIKS